MDKNEKLHKRFGEFFGIVYDIHDIYADLPTRARGNDLEVFGMALTVPGCVDALVGMGYTFEPREDGTVSVRQPAQRDPRGAAMMDYLRLHKDELREVVRARQAVQISMSERPKPDAGGWVVLEGVTPEVAFPVGDLIDDGKAELIGKVIYHRKTGLFDLTYKLLEVG